MKCLVLGGAGFLGSHLIERLRRDGAQVRVLDRIPAAGVADQVTADLGDAAARRKALRGIEVVCHLAGSTDLRAAEEDPAGDFEAHVVPTLRLIDDAVAAGVRKIVHLSSGGTVYGVPAVVPTPEDHPAAPVSVMGIRSLVIERALHSRRLEGRIDFAVLRVANAYGERQRTDGRQGVIGAAATRILRGEPVEVWGDGSTVRDYIYAGDIADAIILAAGTATREKVFNIGSGRGLTTLEVIRNVAAALGRPVEIRHLPERGWDVPRSVLDISRARSVLGWSPPTKFEEGIRRALAHLRVS